MLNNDYNLGVDTIVIFGASLALFHLAHRLLLTKIARTFTLGEAAILAHGITLLSYMACAVSFQVKALNKTEYTNRKFRNLTMSKRTTFNKGWFY